MLDLVKVSVKTLVGVIRDYPNMRDDEVFKHKLFEIGSESEEVIGNFVKRF